MIPSGALFEVLAAAGAEHIHRDTYHASYGFGRYALGLLWYTFLTGNDVNDNAFNIFDESVSNEEVLLAKENVKAIFKKYSMLK